MEFLPFFLILLTSVVFAVAFRSFHLPWVLALIAAGMAIGPYGLNITDVSPTLDFFSQIGLIFLMFMAGLETNFSTFKALKYDIGWLSLINGAIPFFAGIGLGYLLGFSIMPALFLGIIFMSSSIAVIIPTLESAGLIDTKLGKSIVASTIIEDAASLLFLSILLQSIDPVTSLPLPLFYLLLVVVVIGFAYGLPKIRNLLPHHRDEKDLFESEIRIVLVLLIGVVVTFELLGLHPIIAGFFAGLVLSDSIKSDILTDKLRTISYGIFIPVFFIVVGMQTDLSVLTQGREIVGIVLAVVGVSILAKFGSGWLGGKMVGFKDKEAVTIGIATIPQLSTTLAVVFTAVNLGLVPSTLTTAMVALSLVTTLVAPVVLRTMYK